MREICSELAIAMTEESQNEAISSPESHAVPSPDSSSSSAMIHIGTTRLRDSCGYTGTLQYYGPVASSKTASRHYYGVLWDDTSRGKHNGSVVCRTTQRLVSHFHCPHPTAASFVLPHAVDMGRPLSFELLLERYQDESSGLLLQQQTVSTSSGRTKPIEFVGHDKILQQQQLTKLTQVSLRNMGIANVPTSGSDESFASVQHLEHIDLAGNLLSDWADVERLMQQFPNLKHLSLACNRLRRDSTKWLAKGTCQTVVVSGTNKLVHLNVRGGAIENWTTLHRLLQLLPNLQELCCAANDLSDLMQREEDDCSDGAAAANSVFESLQWLDVSGCKLNDFGVVQLAKYFPNLQWLSLDDNCITKWPHDASFSRLEHLQLANTQITDWADLQPINHELPNLQSLRLRNCPLLQDLGELQTRSLVIARFSTLRKFNASVITPEERQDAERHYVLATSRSIQMAAAAATDSGNPTAGGTQETTKQADHDKMLVHYPNYTRLLEKYPDLAARVWNPNGNLNATNENHCGNGASSFLLADSMVSIEIRSMTAQSCTMDPLVRRLPNQLTVGRLKALCSRQFGLPVDLQSLMVRSSSTSIPTPMSEDDRSLEYYGVSDGSEILMHEMDVRQLELERKRDDEEMERRIEQQQAAHEQFQKQKELAARQ